MIPAGIPVFWKPAGLQNSTQSLNVVFVQYVRVCLLVSLAIPVVGSRVQTQKFGTRTSFVRPPELQAIMTEANLRFQSGEYDAAERLYSRGLALSRARHDAFNAACFLAGIGNYLVLTNQYREAAEAFREASTAALSASHADFALRVAVNRATLFRRMGEKEAAVAAMREVAHIVPSDPPSWLLIQAGNMAADQAGIDQAAGYFGAAAERAAEDGDVSTQAAAMTQLGYLQMQAGHLAPADQALTEALRLRNMNGNRQIGGLYSYLSALRLAQGDTASALHLVDRALQTRGSATAVPPPFIRYQRARVLAGSGRLEESLQEYQRAVDLARDWRLRVIPVDTFRTGADVSLQEMYAGYIEATMALFRKTGRPALERRAWELAETNRAASLRESARERKLPAVYWTMLENLRRAIVDEIAGDPAAKLRADDLRRRLSRYQDGRQCSTCKFSHQIKERSSSENLLSSLQKTLAPDEALLSFHTAERASYVWAMTRDSFESHVLPSRTLITGAAERFRASFRDGSDAVGASGTRLRNELFGGISSHVRSKNAWILSVDEPLHGVPFSALRAFDPHLQYLVESHTVRMVPGAAMIAAPTITTNSDRFVGFADAIYNAADPRRPSASEISGGELPRLPGTLDEILASTANWGANRALFTGAQFTRATVQQAVRQPVAVAHFGAHVIPNRATRGAAVMAVGLNASGAPEYLTPSEIAGWRCSAAIVVLSGCHSGTGEALPGAGLVGLTRAWLVAGAQAVAATHWQISDDARPFFSNFYKHLQLRRNKQLSASSAAASLRAAQLETLRMGGSYANPEYWAAFFVVGKE
jgi:CHAT domain-containing protein/tetratricopeptide (TPR) repeat protein